MTSISDFNTNILTKTDQEKEFHRLKEQNLKLIKENNFLLNDMLKMEKYDKSDNRTQLYIIKIETLRREKEELSQCIEKLKQEQQILSHKLEQNIRRSTIQEAEMETDIRKLKQQIFELENITSKQNSMISSMKLLKVEGTSKSSIQYRAKISELETDKKYLQERIFRMSNDQDELIDKLDKKIRQHSLHETELESEIIKLRSKVKHYEITLRDLTGQLAATKEKFSNSIAAAKQQNTELQKEVLEAVNEKNRLLRNKDVLTLENDRLKHQISELKSETNELQNFQSTIKTSLADLHLLKEQVSILEENNDILNCELEDTKFQNEELQKKNKKLESDLKTIMDKLQISSVSDIDNSERNDRKKISALIKKLEFKLLECEKAASSTKSTLQELFSTKKTKFLSETDTATKEKSDSLCNTDKYFIMLDD